ncbi:uncharacterized protein EAE98_003630 [Botrytis deweyae]|uniref:TPR domain protein n=1 Tax=Botrytis deweyae TaxID=2478750 RepID=A0ABQ7IU26_9HELO|nr:uncharacterized protein EAE98_003630 [Botrytis deweyae]KAF7933921.1 hypothetical protein EAE98_003630 [Botrytis deweyae]
MMTSESQQGGAIPSITEYYNLGSFKLNISTKSKDAQVWFNRGLTWAYAFNHEESAICFEQAIAHDHSCAIAYWGLAYALGPNYNKPWETFDESDLKTTVQRTYKASRDAKANAAGATTLEQALIDAIQFRYPYDYLVKDYSAQNRAYADAMESVYEQHPDSLDVATLYADAMMNLSPWQLWDLHTGNPSPGARTLKIKSVLERALDQDGANRHPGLLHMYIHCIEMSPNPELGLNAADYLCDLIPDAGHLRHMPSHLDILIGDYRRAIACNYNASIANEKFLSRSGPNNFYTIYRLHDYHSLIYAAMFAGKSKIALETVAKMEASCPEALLRVPSPPMADWLETFMSVRVHVLVRFGMWEDVIQMELPTDRQLYCVTTAMLHYAKGVAYAATSNVQEAEKERSLFKSAVEQVPATRSAYPNNCADILAVGAAMLDGEIQYRRRSYEEAFASLRKSIELSDGLTYSEPWGWMQPPRHAYAALMLEQGHVEEAAKVYSADLGLDGILPRAHQHPNNVWALQGYHECLTRLGRKTEARLIEPQLKIALAIADVPVKSSCFCRLDTSCSPVRAQGV